jgi:hypothetical protein
MKRMPRESHDAQDDRACGNESNAEKEPLGEDCIDCKARCTVIGTSKKGIQTVIGTCKS